LGRTTAVTWTSSVVSSSERRTAWPRNPVTPVSRIRRPPVPPGVDGAAAGEVCDRGSSGDGSGGGGPTGEVSGRVRACARDAPAVSLPGGFSALVRAALVYRSRHA